MPGTTLALCSETAGGPFLLQSEYKCSVGTQEVSVCSDFALMTTGAFS